MARVRPAFPNFPCCFTGWDNTARRGRHAIVMVDSDPECSAASSELMSNSVMHKEREERVVFINAWNEWAEGMYLEPDAKFGHELLKCSRPSPQRNGDGGNVIGSARLREYV